MNLDLRPMSTGQVLDRTFWLYRRNFLLFAGIAALPPALGFLGQAGLLTAPLLLKNAAIGPSTTSIIAVGTGTLVWLALYIVGYAFATGASVYAVSNAHLGKETTIAQSYQAVSGRVITIIGTGIVVVLMFVGLGVGCALLFGGAAAVTGLIGLRGVFAGLLTFLIIVAEAGFMIWLFLRLAIVVQACVLEKLGPIQSIRRSFFLTRGTVGRLLLIILLYIVIAVAFILILSTPFLVAAATSKGQPDIRYVIGQQFAGFLAGAIATPISLIAFSLVYYDQRVRKEAFDLTLMMEAIGHAPPPMQMGASAGTTGSMGTPNSIG